MARSRVDVFTHLAPTLRMLDRGGILLVTRDLDGRPNAMTIGWAAIGAFWGGPGFEVMVRPSRHTDGNLLATGEFTIAVLGPEQADALSFCGAHSGRDVNKLAECKLTPEAALRVHTPVLAEAAITYECTVLHRTEVRPETLQPAVLASYYRADDYHHVYHGRIVAVTADPVGVARLG